MFLPASNLKTLALIGAAGVACLVLISGLGCGSKSEPVTVSENKTKPAELVPAELVPTELAPTELPPVEPAAVSKDSVPPVVVVEQIAPQAESLKQEQVKQEQVKQEQAKQEQAKQEQAEQEQAEQEQTEQEQAEQEQAEQEQAEKSAGESKKYNDKYTDYQLNKNLTLLMLAYQPDVRARHLLRFPGEQLTADQEEDGFRLLLSHDYLFQRLIQRRQDILNAASDGDETAAELRQIRIETIEISGRLRTLVFRQILTKEQQQARRAAHQEQVLAEKVQAEKRKLKR